jgi:HEAT repeat protein
LRALIAACRSDKFWGVRLAAAVSLGEIGSRIPGLSDRIAALAPGQCIRVRRALVWALGRIGDEPAVRRLKRWSRSETSSFNAGLALLGLAKAARPGALEALQAEVGRDSHREMFRNLLFQGMASLRDARAVPVLLDHTASRFRNEAREAAVKALGRLGVREERVEARLVELLVDPWYRVRTAAAGALQKLKSPRAESAIRDALAREPLDGVRAAFGHALDEIAASR